MNYENFMKDLVCPMNDFRRKLTDKLFAKMDPQGDGSILLEDLK